MEPPQVRIFPHSRTKEFPSEDLLMTWLLNGLRGRGGVYHLRSVDAVANLSPGSIVLFRYSQIIVGEAVVWKEKETTPATKERTLMGDEVEYPAHITLAPSSIRLYSPPLPVEDIQQHVKKDIGSAQPYHILDWQSYAWILKEVVSRGGFVY
jgi:hypothetical protein